ncbi:hypothetical protein A2767_00565 [Candidatus Roizmanbacteria bacterium RIFCSPHIGHO2_01_FULL_35_10]|uniref:OmpR/PhoB-type domain-containing protein n=1 Tax=Candidatus Roizmanbacteria bacterium RIFCSPLOWO2_01_FULL_35_13 TaxID=1802055 RepID=A0A1F7IHJ7_9BACT|nr:MAG: hypothetical protein A2767_00565 [Candidatus Roizmanbacteria bacterium RIFCSPHIGHO2_01_FULL_35_10]OGK42831.1 MAG: hypothetical protein A3A74_01330 [Candidatus Roizmanbacteria bacterium RIFCSPLOWO2_01_FULL_35_13]
MQQYKHWPLHPEDMIDRFKAWKNVLLLKECGFVFFHPFTEHTYQINYFLEWVSTQKIMKPKVISILPSSEDFSDFNLLDSDKKTGILVDNAELLFTPDKDRLLYDLINYSRINETPLILFAEISPFEFKKYVAKFGTTSYYKNLINYPLHDKKSVNTFLRFLEKLLNIRIPKALNTPIFKETGGYLWLIREIIRQINNDKKTLSEIFNSETYRYRIKMIWDRLSQSIKDTLAEFYKKQLGTNKELLKYLTDTRFLNSECKNQFPDFLIRLLKENLASKLEIRSLHVYLNNIDITTHFSIYERKMLTLLISKRNSIVNRDELAKVRWGDNWPDQYSDWAIDQAMYRLKRKIHSLDNTIIISSYRKKGYGISW